ncbi:caffeoyl-CoA O-methyltransferase [Entomortierella parvispora]|uniref:Caffeoyl-CoA O-methyltransferase n=1 Tax=Entomortierella parvispora TaxID=205924 RepID=A0A9P3H802_9FUNG|nr:caffeoyl-CoA O-methyltransferase [Entomortierella parvispora]
MTLAALASRSARSLQNPLRRAACIHLAAPITRSFHALAPQQTMHPTSSGDLLPYCERNSTRLLGKFDELHANTIEHYPKTAGKTISSLQGQFLRLLMRMTRPQRVLELGCFMGFSAMAMADGMGADGVIYTCEKDGKAAQLARELFQRQGYQGSEEGPRRKTKIELMEGNALDSLEILSKNGLQFDAVFLDADKSNYINYFNFIMDNGLLNKGGFILADNVLFSGLVLNAPGANNSKTHLSSPPPSPTLKPSDKGLTENEDRSSAAWQKYADHMDAFNRHVHADSRVEVAVLPVFDGLSVIMHKI